MPSVAVHLLNQCDESCGCTYQENSMFRPCWRCNPGQSHMLWQWFAVTQTNRQQHLNLGHLLVQLLKKWTSSFEFCHDGAAGSGQASESQLCISIARSHAKDLIGMENASFINQGPCAANQLATISLRMRLSLRCYHLAANSHVDCVIWIYRNYDKTTGRGRWS